MLKTLTYSVNFEIEHGLSDDQLTLEKQNELAFMHDYYCLASILWTIGKLNYFYKNENAESFNPVTTLEHPEYLSYIGLALLHDMSGRMQKQYFLKGGQNNA